jgi:pimeloyl-ACP methyl ester carboxylesterase
MWRDAETEAVDGYCKHKPDGRDPEPGGVEMFVRQRGAGRPVLIINGLGASVDMLATLEERLAAVAHTIAVELPGAGRSPTPRRPLSISAMAKLLTDLLDELGHEQADVLGFSLGGIVAQQLAHDAPDRVRLLALASTACGWGSLPGTAEALALISMPIRYYSRSLYERTTPLLSPADRDLLQRVPGVAEARLRHPPSLLGYTYQLTAGALWSSLPWLSNVQAPTLVLAGGGDLLVQAANGIQLARLLPESRLHVLAGEGHLSVCDPESPALPLLVDFFSSRTLARCHAWTSGTIVADDETVEAAFDASRGAQPHRALSDAFRRYVQHSRPNDA